MPRIHQGCDVVSESYKNDEFDVGTKKVIRQKQKMKEKVVKYIEKE
jgi:hypothetical protein